MKKVALLLVLAVLVPSLGLAWLALRSLRDQQWVLERQQSLLLQGVADRLAGQAREHLSERQREFAAQVESLLAGQAAEALAGRFDPEVRQAWPAAEVGFAVTLGGRLLSPSPLAGPAAREFYVANSAFLGNRMAVEVYWNTPKGSINLTRPAREDESRIEATQQLQKLTPNLKRTVTPSQAASGTAADDVSSRVTLSEAEFRQLVGESTDGIVARFVDNRLRLMFWHRSPSAPDWVFGAQVHLPSMVSDLGTLLPLDPSLAGEAAVALLDDSARPMAVYPVEFRAPSWKQPYAATEIGEALPHWEVAVYQVDPERVGKAAQTVTLTLLLLVVALVSAIGAGSWLIVSDVRRQLTVARQKSDFVSNVSHELKTPLTSIRMFAELLGDDRVADPARRREFLAIIGAESARLTRLINQVLDFSRMERGERTWKWAEVDLREVAQESMQTCRPPLEAAGVRLETVWGPDPVWVRGERDALVQVAVNLLSNVEKYAAVGGEARIGVGGAGSDGRDPEAWLEVLDRGPGVPRGAEERVFEQFVRGDDSLASGIPGSGLGLALARRVARAHGGDLTYQRREGGGSVFRMTLPLAPTVMKCQAGSV